MPDILRHCNAAVDGYKPVKTQSTETKNQFRQKPGKGRKMMTLVIEHDNGKAGQKGFSEHQISEKVEAQKIINCYEEKGILIYSVNFCQF